jgi:hypothetical protein
MQWKAVFKMSMVAVPILVVSGLMVAASPARVELGRGAVHDDDVAKGCSNRTLRGDYGFLAQGVLIGIPGLPTEVQFRSVGVAHFDGKGNLTWQEHTVENGRPLNPDWVQASGTYAVNPNCTGAAVVNTPNSPFPLTLSFVVVKEGREIQMVLDSNAIASVFTKVD